MAARKTAASNRKPKDETKGTMQPEGKYRAQDEPNLELLRAAALNHAQELDIKEAFYQEDHTHPDGKVMVADLKDGTRIVSR